MGGKTLDPEYNRKYYLKHKEKLKQRAKERYYRVGNTPEFKRSARDRQDVYRFGCTRRVIFAKTGGNCYDCKKLRAQVVHHMDRDGRSSIPAGHEPGQDPERLIGLCRSCHMKEHGTELAAARRENFSVRWSYHYDSCVVCKKTDRKHAGRGRCVRCAGRLRWQEKRKLKGRACSL